MKILGVAASSNMNEENVEREEASSSSQNEEDRIINDDDDDNEEESHSSDESSSSSEEGFNQVQTWKMKPEEPEKFDGNPAKARSWLDDFKYCCVTNKWGEKLTCELFPRYLKESARTWYISEIANTKFATKITKLEAKFKEQYVPLSERREIARELHSRKQKKGEYVGNFISDMNKLCSDYDKAMTEADRVDRIM